MSRLSIRLLGPFQTFFNGKLLENFKSDKARALLAYLAVEAQRPHSRSKIASLLWAEMSDTDALANLRFTLSSLRKTLEDKQASQPVLNVGRETLQLNPLSDVWVDVAFFEQQVAYAAELNPVQAMPYLTAAMHTYLGDFMEGFYLPDCLGFDDWLFLRREKLHTQALSSLYTLAQFYENYQQWENALTYTRRALDLAPWDEGLHQKAMRLFVELGNTASAWAQYQSCKRLLEHELQLAPSAETKTLALQIRTGKGLSPPSTQPQTTIVSSERICVARGDELAQLQSGLRAALNGQGQTIFISGEAGSGKTTLLDYFLSQTLAAQPRLLAAWGDCSTLSETLSLPFQPFRDILESLTGEFSTQRATGLFIPEYAQRIWNALPQICQTLVESGADLIGVLLPVENLQKRVEAFTLPGASWRRALDEIAARHGDQVPVSQEQLLAQITRLFQSLSDLFPLVLVLDDLQWADAASLNLLYHFGQRLKNHRVLVIGAYRPLQRRGTTSLSLMRVVREIQRRSGQAPINLDHCDGRAFIEAWLEKQSYKVSADFREKLFQQTGGQALFTVDTLRAMQENEKLIRDAHGCWVESPSLDWQTIPARVDAILATDFERIPAMVCPLLQIASLLGDIAAAKVISLVAEMDEVHVNDLFATLPGRDLAWLQLQTPKIIQGQISQVYRFRHQLYQQFVAQQISPVERITLHHKIGHVLASFHEAGSREFTAQIAYHFEQAGDIEQTIPYLLDAAEHASSLSAYEQSITLLTRGLELLSMLPSSSARDAYELQLLNALSGQLMGGIGWGSEERMHAIQRAYELCQQAGETTASQFLLTLFSLADMARARGQHAESLALGQQMMQLAEELDDQEYLALTHWSLGATYFYQGQLTEAQYHLEMVLHLHSPATESRLTTITGTDAAVVSLCWLSWINSLMGNQKKAWAIGAEAVVLANQINHPFNQTFALIFGDCGLHALQGDWQAVLESIDSLLSLVQQEDLTPMLPWALVFEGWAQTLSSYNEDGIETIRKGMAAWRDAGAVSGLTCMGYYLAEACLHAGRLAEAQNAIEETLALIEQTGERLFEPALLQVKEQLTNTS